MGLRSGSAFLDRVTEASRTAQRQMNDDDAFKKRRKKRDDYDDGDYAAAKPRQVFAGLKKEARVVEEAACDKYRCLIFPRERDSHISAAPAVRKPVRFAFWAQTTAMSASLLPSSGITQT